MARRRNTALAEWMHEHEMTAEELADRVNGALTEITGRRGTTGERTVFRWLSGESRWPQARLRRALETVTGVAARDLGFVPRGHHSTEAEHDQETPMLRRTLITGIAAAAAPLAGARHSVGSADVIRLRNGLDMLMAADDAQGGSTTLERAALAGARDALALQQRGATDRVRLRLFSLAANYTATAAWSCIDARRLDQAEEHLKVALQLAGMAKDSEAAMRVWNSTAMLAHQRGRHTDAVAAAQAAQSATACRRDPLYASLAHARTAVGHANRRARQPALRSIGHAGEALAKARDEARPSWIAFYGPAELHALTAIVRDRLGDAAESEAASHRALSVLPVPFRRNRALATSRLALAQLHQGDIGQACATTEDAFRLMEGAPLPGRMRTLLGDFHRDLISAAPSTTEAREWADRHRTEWSRTA
ncbi:XRE family transcriptional regulator [Streptomyces sp. NPDC001553]|uniref:XRE family transcriptional regulator n=1 Tax=Streptomyces sp. NPDC001553 TaxID=3154385 RepID=UPI00332FA09B